MAADGHGHVFDPPDEDGKIEGGNEVHPMAHKKKSDNKPKEVKKKEEKKPPKKIVPKPIVIPETKPLPPQPQIPQRQDFVPPSNHTTPTINKPQPPQFLNLSPSLFLSHLPQQCLLNQNQYLPQFKFLQFNLVLFHQFQMSLFHLLYLLPQLSLLQYQFLLVGQSLQFQMFLFLLPFPLRLSLPLPQQVNLPKKFQEKTN